MNALQIGQRIKKQRLTKISSLFFAKPDLKNKYQLELVETPKQYRVLLRLRKRIFMEGEGYPYTHILNGYERESIHILAKEKKSDYVGMVSVKFHDEEGLPIQNHLEIGQLSNEYKLAEIDKLGVMNQHAHMSAFIELISAAYGLIRFCGYNAILIFTLKKKKDNIDMYEKIGFKQIGEFDLFNAEKATAMILDLDNTEGVMWKTSQLIKGGKRLLSCIG